MDNKEYPDDKIKRATKQYPHIDLSGYVFFYEHGMYLKKGFVKEKERQPQANSQIRPFFVSANPDYWGRLIALLTLLVLIAYTIWTWRQWKTLDSSVHLSQQQFQIAEQSELTVADTLTNPSTVGLTFTNVGKTDADRVFIRFQVSQFPDPETVFSFGYNPVRELQAFLDGKTLIHHPEKLSASQKIGTRMSNGSHSFDDIINGTYVQASFSPGWPLHIEGGKQISFLLVAMDWDDTFGHRRGNACAILIGSDFRQCGEFFYETEH